MTDWISVEDRLPDFSDVYWCAFDNGETYICQFTTTQEWLIDGYPNMDVTVTHWMYLPHHPEL